MTNTDPSTTTNTDPEEPTDGRRMVGYPSPAFPGPPRIQLAIPEDWLAIEPSAYIRPDRKVDLAVCAPAPVDGVTPSVVMTVLRALPTDDPEGFLETALEHEMDGRVNTELMVKRYQNQPRPALNAVTQTQLPGKLMEHLQVLTYIDDPRMAHVINVTGVYAADSSLGRDLILGIIGPRNPDTEPG